MKCMNGLRSGRIIPGYSATKEERERHAEMEKLIRWYFPPSHQRMALWVAWNVSGMETLARNRRGEGSYGLYQLSSREVGWPPENGWLLHNPIRNVAAAYGLWCKYGWEYWTVPPLPPAPFTDAGVLGV